MTKKKAAIIGGGISGLAAAWYLRDRFDVVLFEKEARLGGWIQSEKSGGFLFEKGPRSLRPGKAFDLAKELGLESDIVYADKAAGKRYLYTGGKLKNVLSCLWPAAPALMTEWMKAKGEGDESIKSFISRRFNSYAAETLIDPLVSGIYAGDIEKLSMKSCFPGLYEMEQVHGSLTKGLLRREKSSGGGLYTFKNGLETLVAALADQVPAAINLSASVEGIEIRGGSIKVFANNQSWSADHAILALPAAQTSQLLKEYDPQLSQLLNEIECVSVAVVNAGYRHPVLGRKGFGHLIPRKEGEPVLGVVWDSSAFPGQNSSSDETRLTVMIGGAHMKNFDRLGKSDFIAMALESLGKHLGIRASPDIIECEIAKNAIPQYVVGHDKRAQKIKEKLSSLTNRIHIAGNSFSGVSVNDCIDYAESLSNSLF
jgi:protoporphyrinogen/coproporphyrinogen III oxidase